MPDTPTTSLEASAPRPVTSPAAQRALREMRITAEDVTADLRLAAARLAEAECDLHCALLDDPRPAPDTPAAPGIGDQFTTLRRTILDDLPQGYERDQALARLEDARYLTDAAIQDATTRAEHLRTVHHIPDTPGPEGAA